jgi:hypothetical protein
MKSFLETHKWISKSLLGLILLIPVVGVNAMNQSDFSAMSTDEKIKAAKKAGNDECPIFNPLPNVTASTIGSLPSLQTKLFTMYSDPVSLQVEDNASNIATLQGWTLSLGTNTIPNNKDSTRLQLLFLNSGAYNLYVSHVGLRGSKKTALITKKDSTQPEASIDCNDPVTSERVHSTDRQYWQPIIIEESSAQTSDKWHLFFSNGIGARALTGTGTSTTGYGTFYLGIGLDKGGYTFLSKVRDGFFSLELYGSATTINKRSLNTMFSTTSAPGWFATAGVDVRMAVNATVDLKLTYAKALGGFGRDQLGDMTMVSVALKTEQIVKAVTEK